jgi:hypothetical protein
MKKAGEQTARNGRAVVAAMALAWMADAEAQTADEVRALLERGQPGAAYDLARRGQERLGEAEFDLYFGIAAVNSGHASEGVLALERFLLRFPDHEGARVELARGYFLIGEDARSREEFEAALKSGPTPEAARVIGEYLDALRARESRYRPTAMGYVEAGYGYDSNPRAGVDNALITLPIFGEVTVDESGVRKSDRTSQYGAGFRLTGPLTDRVVAFAAGQADAIEYPHESDFNQRLYAGSVGVAGQWRRQSWRLGASSGYQTLGGSPYRHTSGVFGDWVAPLRERLVLSTGIQAGKLDYSGANVIRNSDFWTATVALRHAFAVRFQPLLELSANGGRERNVNDDRQDLSRDIYGGRIGMTVALFSKWTFGAAGTYQRSRYLEADPVLETARVDRYASGDLSIACNPLPGLTFRAEFSDAKNRSNLALYEYSRRTAIIRGRYEFK